ncbi:DDB1- and CUL4-associated factor 1 isoform X2 [Agrilus planipennis]|uniref:DDB1- and CUL4-associated factor 1 n=1 Tax=Agrilus planipennis TaxID=224129 RepID=A0A1W4XES6_AGRPL|nr:DDB1- and CUL4-associated factor 1 isoform X2 [Agrilus planipennis]
MENQNGQNVVSEITTLMRSWEDENAQPNYNPVPTLTRMAEIIEVETENYFKMDPDPFDERHPSRTDPDCKLGQILKALFRKDNFMTKLVNDYLRDTYNHNRRQDLTGRDIDEMNIAACRLMLDILPGLETSVVFQPDMDGLIQRLIKWATNSIEPLQSYATGLLAAAMEIPEIATRFREQNGRLVPLLLQRLRHLQQSSDFANGSTSSRPFAHFSSIKSPPYKNENRKSPSRVNNNKILTQQNGVMPTQSPNCSPPFITSPDRSELENQIIRKTDLSDTELEEGRRKRIKLDIGSPIRNEAFSPTSKVHMFSETSNSSWAELESYVIGTMQMYPPTLATKQILILRYLTPMGEYQEFLSHVFENNALELILCYVNVRETKEARLAFEALKYLAALLCHKKFSIEFIHCKGLECLLEVPRPSIAATGVSICLYYLGYCEEAMERVCLLPKYIVNSLVKYALWLLECSHDSGRCHATMFFGLTFQFRVILEEFDEQDGLRKMHNVISTLPILSSEENTPPLNEDVESAARQIVRHVCVAYKRYLEAHLYIKVEQLRRSQLRPNEKQHLPALPSQPSYKACKSSPEEVQQQIESLFQLMPFRAHWPPVDQMLKLGAMTLLLKIIAFAYEWNYSGRCVFEKSFLFYIIYKMFFFRAETVRCALDALAIACVMPKVQLLFCDRVDLPEETLTVGMNIILGAADGEIVADPDVQKAALRVIVNCVCAPIQRVGGAIARYSTNNSQGTSSPSKKTKFKSSEELIQKVWDCVRANSGIMVLLTLMQVKTPITDADCIRTLACKALAGLARSETVRQIVSKLPLFTSGGLQNLMRDPILQEKRQEHVTFQKYALELLERLSGKTKHNGKDLEVSLANIHRANVVAQTKIHFNDRQLLQLIHQHLVSKGLEDSAATLLKEAHLTSALTVHNSNPLPTKFRYSSSLTPSRQRLSFTSSFRNSQSTASQGLDSSSSSSTLFNGPSQHQIKLVKKNPPQPHSSPMQNARLQKQLSSEPLFKVVMPPSSNNSDESLNGLEPRITLDSIITEYLTNQHALCKNPMATCPQFNLFVPHKCPDPKPKIQAANNFVMRCARRTLGYQSKALDRKLIHSRFCPVQTIRLPTDDGFFTCVRFTPGDQSVIVGEYSGEIRFFNLHTGNEESSFQAHDSYVDHIEPNREGSLIVSSSRWGRPLSALWSPNGFEMKYAFESDEYLEFSKTTQDKIIGTKGEEATIYDVNTGLAISRLVPTVSNNYTRNKATFSPFDDLVLSDGVLFDVNTSQQIHKLDKLNQMQSGVFHPNGLEIVSNTEVWDIRTFQLLKTVPVLNQCEVTFSPVNSAIYAISLEQEDDPLFDSSFKTVDATDYSSIATIDVKKSIYYLAVNKFDSQIAIVENQGAYHSVQESVVRIYDVGRRRDDEDEQEEEDDEEDMDGSDDDGSENDTVVMDVVEEVANNDNNGNNEGDGGDGGDNDGSDSDVSWTDLSDNSNDSYVSGSSGMSAIEDLLFEY